MERIQEVVRIAFDECCLDPVFGLSSLCFAGSQGIYNMLNASAGGITVQVCVPDIPEDCEEDRSWDGMVVVGNGDKSHSVPLVKLIDAIQSLKDKS